jgi:formate dehydrogenase subunit gamma
LLEILIALNETRGYVDARAIPVIAEELNLSRADVHGVMSFYHDLRERPAGQHVVKVCCAEACQAQGAHALLAELEAALGIALGETTPDGQVTLEAVYCLGNCALGPAALVDGELAGRCDAERVLTSAGRKA